MSFDQPLAFTKYEIKELNMNISNLDRGTPWDQLMETFNNATLTAKATDLPENTITFKDMQTLIASFGIMSASQDFKEKRVLWSRARVTAHECALYFCANIYQSSVTNGALQETLVESHAPTITGGDIASASKILQLPWNSQTCSLRSRQDQSLLRLE
jgi:hypothetical protein